MTLSQLKSRVHQYLDAIWMIGNDKRKARTSMYKWLAIQMSIPESKCHVRYFNKKQCIEAIRILKPRYIQLMGHDLDYDSNNIVKEKLKNYIEQSPDTVHLVNTRELQDFLESTDMYIIYDDRLKIEDLNLFKRQLKNEVDDKTYKKLESFIENYLKFYNK